MIINKCRKMDESFKYVIKTISSMVNYAFIYIVGNKSQQSV